MNAALDESRGRYEAARIEREIAEIFEAAAVEREREIAEREAAYEKQRAEDAAASDRYMREMAEKHRRKS
jgi:hypothetical protein